jgi:hypothetical protein
MAGEVVFHFLEHRDVMIAGKCAATGPGKSTGDTGFPADSGIAPARDALSDQKSVFAIKIVLEPHNSHLKTSGSSHGQKEGPKAGGEGCR